MLLIELLDKPRPYTYTGTEKEDKSMNEKWSKKYKNSINCSNPKGFSQKAHCASKKKG